MSNNGNESLPYTSDDGDAHGIEVTLTAVYAVIFFTALIGNISTCIVIARNKSMHTATNYYLFSLAVSDLLLLTSGLPGELCLIWSPNVYVFGKIFCPLQSFLAETSANATVLTITAFTVERYLAICHPFLSHTMSKLSRAVRYVVGIWCIALCLAVPQAIQFGVVDTVEDNVQMVVCTVMKHDSFEHAFEISTFIIFVGPMTLISVLYILIAIKLRKSRLLSCENTAYRGGDSAVTRSSRTTAAQNRVIKMLVAVVAAFFICWAPFHAQRLLAVYLSTVKDPPKTLITIYTVLVHTSGVLYFLSTTINPLLYHIMSNKFRKAFKATLLPLCYRKRNAARPKSLYTVLSRYPPSMLNYQRSVSDVRNSNTDQPNNNKDARAHEKSARNNFQLTSKPSQTTVLTNISRLANDFDNFNNETNKSNGFEDGSRHNNKNGKARRNDKYLNRILKMLKLNNGPIGGSEIFASKQCNNSISNSSLQDLDQMEFSSSDLVKYMEEINVELAT